MILQNVSKAYFQNQMGGTGLWPVVSGVPPETVAGRALALVSLNNLQRTTSDEIRRDASATLLKTPSLISAFGFTSDLLHFLIEAIQRLCKTRPTMNWIVFALMTVVSWGVYGIFLHTGQMEMKDAINGRYKAFLFVGLAYFLTAVLAPLVLLLVRGADWNYSKSGMGWSLLAGIVGAIGAFCVLLAFGAKGTPAVVMSIVFAGAPVVNAVVAVISHPPAGGWSGIKPQFYVGILLAAIGGCLVTFYKPNPPVAKPQASIVQSASANPVSK